MRPLRLVCGLLAVAACAGPARSDEPVTLRYKLDEADRLLYRTVVRVEQSQTIGELEISTILEQTDIAERTLEQVDDEGNLHVRSDNQRLHFKMTTNGQEYTFDSTADKRDTASTLGAALTPVFDRLNRAVLTFVITPRGEVKQAPGFKDLLADVLKDNPIGAQAVAGGSDEAAVLSAAEQFPLLPEGPVRPGDRWEQPLELELPGLGKAAGRRVFKYEGPDKVGERPTARISLSGDLSIELDTEGDAKVTGSISTEQASGTAHFDPQTGQVVSLESRYTLSGTLSVEVNGNTIQVAMRQKQKTTVEQIDELP